MNSEPLRQWYTSIEESRLSRHYAEQCYMSCSPLPDLVQRNEITRTHRKPRIACDTITWITGNSLSIGRLDSVEHWNHTFEWSREIAIMGTNAWGEVVVEETYIADSNFYHARVPEEYVNKYSRRHRWLTYRIRMNRMRIGLPNGYVSVKGWSLPPGVEFEVLT